MVFALAGDSTMTRRRSATGALFGSETDPPRRSAGCAGHHSGAVAHRKCPQRAILQRPMPVNPRPSWPYLAHRRAQLPGASAPLRERWTGVERLPDRRRVRPRRQPLVELRPLAARDAALPPAVPPLHGQVGAVLVPARAVHRRLWCVSRSGGGSATRRPSTLRSASVARPRRRDVPRGHAPREGPTEDATRRGGGRAPHASRSKPAFRSSPPGSPARPSWRASGR